MSIKIQDILAQKISEIQSRVPLKMKGIQQEQVSFQAYLNGALQQDLASDKALYTANTDVLSENNNVERAKFSRANSTAYVPEDKAELMDMIDKSVKAASAKYGVDEYLIRAIIKQESAFHPYSLSHAGAQGLMQLMPGTADALGVTDPWNIDQNIDGGTQYLRDQLNTFNGDIKLSLAAYNAGPGSVQKYDGIPPYAETQDYVQKVMHYYKMYMANAG